MANDFDYYAYDRFLKKYVSQDRRIGEYELNVVDYEAIFRQRDDPHSLYRKVLEQLTMFDPGSISGRKRKIAFWINAYNVGAIKIIIDSYPVKSIKSMKINLLKNPWGMRILTIGGREYSLGEIEHEVLIGMFKEPLAHFAIVCASLDCPDIIPEPYRGQKLMEQLRRQARKFLSDGKRGMRIEREKGVVYFSKIFKFDRLSFPEGAKDAVPLIAPFLQAKDREFLTSGNYKIEYLEYDWSLNSLEMARRQD